MSSIERRTRPYEFLVRWGADGHIAGAHVQTITELVEDGQVLSARLSEALPVAMADQAGVPLQPLLSEMQATALATAEARIAEAHAALQHSQMLQDKLQQAEHEAQRLNARLAEASTEIGKLSTKLLQAAQVIQHLRQLVPQNNAEA